MLTVDQKYILSTLSDYLHSRSASAVVKTDYVTGFVKSQQLAAIFYNMTHSDALKQDYITSIYYTTNRNNLLRKIDSALHDADIQYMILKGTEISKFYYEPYDRQFGDIDILVKEKDKERAQQLLFSMGFYDAGGDYTECEWILSNGIHELELHHRLIYSDYYRNEQNGLFTDTAWEHCHSEDGIRFHLENEFHFMFVLVHLKKHFMHSGVSMRRFLDLAIMMTNADMDWSKAEEYLERTQSLNFAKVCFAFIERWFGVTCPIGCAEISDAFYEETTETVFSKGVFCRTDDNSDSDILAFMLSRDNGRFCTVFRTLFPNYKWMQNKYPKMGRYKALLPVMWMRRLFEVFFKKRKLGKIWDAIKKNSLKEKIRMFKRYGL